MKLGLHQSARMEQRLIQSPQMIQAMQILQLSSLDLLDRIDQELTENPYLERVENGEKEDEAGGPTADEPEPSGVERMLDVLERYERDFGDGPRVRAGGDDDGDRKFEAMQNTPDAPKNLAGALIDQLAFLDLDERGRAIAEYIVYSLDHRGYLEQPLEEICQECGIEGATIEELQGVLAELRHMIHPALGAQDLRECLLLQLDAMAIEVPLVRVMIEEHLENITTNRLPRIAKATGSTLEDVKNALETMRGLDPTPGSEYGDSKVAVILPDVTVEEIDGKFEITLNKARTPELRLSRQYRQILRQAKNDDPAQEWLRKRLESARWFIDAIHQRQSTLERIANAIFERQKGFLERGVRGLVPLRMQEIADDVSVHISTVSRAVSGKYAQTPRGTFPLKYFFTGGTKKESGGVASQASIKQRIQEFVSQEDSSAPLSDDQLAALLEERDNIRIARRTVTKYRKALGLPASSQRREF